MNHTVSEVAPCRKKIECAFDAAEVDRAFDECYQGLRDDVAIKGFRKGRAPRALLERRFAKGAAQDVASKLVSQGLETVMKDDHVNPMAEPKITPDKPVAAPGAAFEFSAEVDVRPEFELADYKGLVLQEPSVEPNEAEIGQRLDNLRENFADRAKSEAPAAKGDLLEVDAVVTARDPEKGEDEEVLKLDGQYLRNDGERLFDIPCPDLVAKLTGAAVGDSITFLQNLPDDYPNPKLRGREAKIVLRVKGIETLTLPAADDEFAKRLQCDTLDELKGLLADHVRRQKQEERHENLQEQIIDQLTAKTTFELPAEFMERQTQSQLIQQWMRLARMGVSQDFLRENAEDMKTKTRAQTERGVRWSIIADAIAEKENIEVTPEEIQDHIAALAAQERVSPAQIAQRIREQGDGGLYAVAAQLRDVKIANFLIGEAKLEPADERSDDAKRREERQHK